MSMSVYGTPSYSIKWGRPTGLVDDSSDPDPGLTPEQPGATRAQTTPTPDKPSLTEEQPTLTKEEPVKITTSIPVIAEPTGGIATPQ